MDLPQISATMSWYQTLRHESYLKKNKKKLSRKFNCLLLFDSFESGFKKRIKAIKLNRLSFITANLRLDIHFSKSDLSLDSFC